MQRRSSFASDKSPFPNALQVECISYRDETLLVSHSSTERSFKAHSGICKYRRWYFISFEEEEFDSPRREVCIPQLVRDYRRISLRKSYRNAICQKNIRFGNKWQLQDIRFSLSMF